MSKENWNRWGTDDERGALNHIDADVVRRAATLVTTGQVVSLAQPLSARTPFPPHRSGMQHFMGRSGADYAAGARRPGGFQFAEDTLLMPAHIGTHIDGLCHAWYDDQLYNGFPGAGTRGTTGASRCGIDKMGPIAARGVLLDVAAVRGGIVPDGSAIGVDDLARASAAGRIGTGQRRRRADPHRLGGTRSCRDFFRQRTGSRSCRRFMARRTRGRRRRCR